MVLFFLSKQGELAQQLLDARQTPAPPSHQGSGGGGGAAEAFFIGNGGGEAAGAAGDGGLVTFTRETDRHGIYCGIGRQIAELMRFLQLNGALVGAQDVVALQSHKSLLLTLMPRLLHVYVVCIVRSGYLIEGAFFLLLGLGDFALDLNLQ